MLSSWLGWRGVCFWLIYQEEEPEVEYVEGYEMEDEDDAMEDFANGANTLSDSDDGQFFFIVQYFATERSPTLVQFMLFWVLANIGNVLLGLETLKTISVKVFHDFFHLQWIIQLGELVLMELVRMVVAFASCTWWSWWSRSSLVLDHVPLPVRTFSLWVHL